MVGLSKRSTTPVGSIGEQSGLLAQRQIERFCQPYRQAILSVVAGSAPLRDLLNVFPGMAFALATGYATPAVRERCRRLVCEGRPLKESAEALGLPRWLRRLPPEAFTSPLGRIPATPEFERRIVNHLPIDAWRAPGWLKRVLVASDLAGEEFALWIAWRTKTAARLRDGNRLALMAAWAWFSGHPDTLGHKLVRRRFEPTLSYRKANEEAEAWRQRLDLAVALGEGIKDTWYPASTVDGYALVPLKGYDDFIAEATAMQNCLDQYGNRASLLTSRFFSIRKDGATVATLEIGPHEDDIEMPKIEQLRGPGNRRVPAAIWQAVYRWLSVQNVRPLSAARGAFATPSRTATARAIWRPYLESVASLPNAPVLRAYLRSGEVRDPEP